MENFSEGIGNSTIDYRDELGAFAAIRSIGCLTQPQSGLKRWSASRSSIGSICPRPNKYRNMIMSRSLLDIEFDFNLGPKAFNLPLLVPIPNREFDTPCRFATIIQPIHDILNGRRAAWQPLFDPTIAICGCVEADSTARSFSERLPWGKQFKLDIKVSGRCSRERVKNMTGYGR